MVLLAVGRNTETSKTVYCLSQLLALAQVSFKVKNHKQNKNKHLLVFLLFHSSIPSYNRIILSHTLVILLDFFPLS